MLRKRSPFYTIAHGQPNVVHLKISVDLCG